MHDGFIPKPMQTGESNMADFLGLRCQMALARVLLPIDEQRVHQLAEEAFRGVARQAHAEYVSVLPWPLQDEPALVYAFERGRDIGERDRILSGKREAQAVERAALHAAQDAQRAALRKAERSAYEESIPCAAVMLVQLQAGNLLDLNGHTIEWDCEFKALAGTNAYGIDYCWGDMTLESVERWRSAMLAQRTIGPCPPGADEDDDDYFPEEDFGWDGPEFDLWNEFQCLQAMCGLRFDERLGVIPQSIEPPVI
jgi:hypothetical protein